MDTGAAVEEGLARIKGQMPETYKSIQVKAASAGKVAFALVRRGLRGEANCFWACERGHVVGTPFSDQEVTRDVAQLLVQFGGTFVCIWGKESLPGGSDGSN
jgi:hypothetical protein